MIWEHNTLLREAAEELGLGVAWLDKPKDKDKGDGAQEEEQPSTATPSAVGDVDKDDGPLAIWDGQRFVVAMVRLGVREEQAGFLRLSVWAWCLAAAPHSMVLPAERQRVGHGDGGVAVGPCGVPVGEALVPGESVAPPRRGDGWAPAHRGTH